MKTRRYHRRSKSQYYQSQAQEYMRIKKVDEFDPDEVAQWMVDNDKFSELAPSAKDRCKKELVNALRAQRHLDDDQQEVRSMLGARLKNAQGELFSKWAPLYDAKPAHARLAGQQWRRGIRGEVLLHDRTFKSYNKFNKHGAQLPMFDHDYNKDIAESAMSEDYPDERPSDDKPAA